MKQSDLYSLVERAKEGDREAMNDIVVMFQPAIGKACRNAHPDERNDLKQHLSEKIIKAVMEFDMSLLPSYSQFISQLSIKLPDGLTNFISETE